MPRSLIREEQIVDEDVLSEEEHDLEPHYFKNLVDVTTYSGYAGKYVKVKTDNSGLEYDLPSTGEWIDASNQSEREFYHGTTDPTISGVTEGSIYFKYGG